MAGAYLCNLYEEILLTSKRTGYCLFHEVPSHYMNTAYPATV